MRLYRALRHRVGFRGYFLLTLTVVDLFTGLSFIQPATPAAAQANAYLADSIPFDNPVLSNWAWAVFWWLAGAFCLVNAFRIGHDHWGFGVAVAIKVAYIVSLFYATQHGMPDGWRRMVVWAFIASSVWVMSRWPEPARPLADLARELEETDEIDQGNHERDRGGDA